MTDMSTRAIRGDLAEVLRRERAAGGIQFAVQCDGIGLGRKGPQVRYALDHAGEFESEVWPAVISRPNVDEYESIIHTDGIDLSFFQENPVVFMDHGWLQGQGPIGRALSIVALIDGENSRLESTFVLGRGFKEADDARLRLLQRLITKTSIGFRPQQTEWEQVQVVGADGQTATRAILHVVKSTMLEFSLVGIPGNIQTSVGEPAKVLSYPSPAHEARAHAAHIVSMLNKRTLTADEAMESCTSLLKQFDLVEQDDWVDHAVRAVRLLGRIVEDEGTDKQSRQIIAAALACAFELTADPNSDAAAVNVKGREPAPN